MTNVFIREQEGKVYLEYEYYDYGTKTAIQSFNVADIKCIEEVVGPKGGFHGFNIVSKKEVGHPTSINGREQKYEHLASYGRKHWDLLERVREVLSEDGIEFTQVYEDGSAYP